MLFIKYLLNQKTVLLLCTIVYKVLWQNSIFCSFKSILIDLSSSVKCASVNGDSRKENHLRVAFFPMSQPTNLISVLWDQYFCNLSTKLKSCCDDPVILQGTFIVKYPQILLISTVRSLDNFAVIKTQIVVCCRISLLYFSFGSIKLSG